MLLISNLIKEIKINFSYDSNTGVITSLTRKNSNGSIDKDGYLIIKFKGIQYKAHRIAWVLYYGRFPKDNIDHINNDRTDNRINNLRLLPQRLNCLNRDRNK